MAPSVRAATISHCLGVILLTGLSLAWRMGPPGA
jgi:hypothetical protein